MKIDANSGFRELVYQSQSKRTVDPKEAAKLKDTCNQFEALFLYQIMEKARQALPKSDLAGNPMGEDLFKGMLNQELAGKMAQAGGMGLGKMLYDQLSKSLKTIDDQQKDS